MKKIINLPRRQKQLIALIGDLFFLPLLFYFCVLLRYEGVSDASSQNLLDTYAWMFVTAPLFSIPIFLRLGLYRAVIRFIDQKIILIATFGVSLSVLCMLALAAALHMPNLSRSVFAIYWVSAILYVVASRLIARDYLLGRERKSNHAVRIAIYGAGHTGMQLTRALRADNKYTPVVLIDDNQELHGNFVSGIRVWPTSALPRLVQEKKIQEILLAMPSVSKARHRNILEKLEPLKIKIKIAPSITNLVDGSLRIQDVRDVDINDLLGRDEACPDQELLSACITRKTVMVTGAGGSIGSELCRQIILLEPLRLVLLDMSEHALYKIDQELQIMRKNMKLTLEILPFLGSVLDAARCTEILSRFSVDTVYHAAAYKHVPLVEHNPIQGVYNNVFGTKVLAQAAIDAHVSHFVLISTDKAVRPTNVMGASKRLSELILQALTHTQQTTLFCMVRFGNVLGSSGSVIPLFRQQILAGGPITVTHPEITRYFMTIPEAAQLVLQASSMGQGGDVFVLDMGEPVKIVDLATRMAHLSGLKVRGESDAPDAIAIEYVGLRPGEKLYEELLIGTNVEGTQHPLILRAQEAYLPWEILADVLIQMKEACTQLDPQALLLVLQRAVEDYTPQGEIKNDLWRASKSTN